MRLLLVEDDPRISDMLATALTRQHYIVDVAHDTKEAFGYLETLPYDLLLLDIVLPGMDGLAFCRQLRSQGFKPPILLLTAKDSSEDKVQGLDAGADDYLIKPFDFPELLARLRALTRRGNAPILSQLEWGELCLTPSTGEVTYRGELLKLTPTEYNLLELFLRNPRKIFSYDDLIDHLWPLEPIPSENTIRSHIRRLRRKFKANGFTIDPIETVYGLGYRLNETQETSAIADHDDGGETFSSLLSGPLSEPFSGPLSEPLSKPFSGPLSGPLSNPFLGPFVGDFSPALSFSPIKPSAPEPLQQQLQAQLYQQWLKYRDSIIDDANLLASMVDALVSDLDSERASQASYIAHNLAGLSGSLGIAEASQSARHLEHLLNVATQDPLNDEQVEALRTTVASLIRQLEQHSAPHPIHSASSVTGEPISEAIAKPATTSSHNILMIVPNPPATEPLCQLARTHDLNLTTATSLDQGKQLLSDQPTDLVLIDLNVSQEAEDSWQFLQYLQEQAPAIPAIVLTKSGDLHERLRVARTTAIAVLNHPCPPEQLLKTIQQALFDSTSEPAKILVVDDSPKFLAVLQSVLPADEFELLTLSQPVNFWQTLESFVPNLLILDMQMPELAGIDLCRVVRNDPRWQELPILFVTAHAQDPDSLQSCLNAGADDCISKSVVVSELRTRILSHLSRVKRLRRSSW